MSALKNKILLMGSTYNGKSTQLIQTLKEIHFFLNFVKTVHYQVKVSPPALKKNTQNHLRNKIFKNKRLTKPWKVTQTFQTSKSYLIKMAGNPLPFSYHSRRNSRDNRDTSRQRSRKGTSNSYFWPYYGNSNFKPPNRAGSSYPRPQQNKINYINNN